MKASKEFDNFTFSQLNEFSDDWISKTTEYECLFKNQADEILLAYFGTQKNNEKCEAIHQRMNLLFHLEEKIQRHVNKIDQRQATLLDLVLKLEEKSKLLDKPNINVDICRAKIYTNVCKINNAMMDMKNSMQDINFNVLRTDQKDLKDPAEYIARILMSHLYTLEMIEERIEKITNMLRIIHSKKCMLIHKPPLNFKLCF